MGYYLKAICRGCGFKKEVSFGGVKSNYTTVCNVPAINKTTGELEEINTYDKTIDKDNFDFYNNPKMWDGNIDSYNYYNWGDIYLKKIKNLCPECKKFSMAFEVTMLTD